MSFGHTRNTASNTEFSELHTVFFAVTGAALEIRSLPLIQANRIDHDQPPVGRLYNALAVEYIADVEAATKASLRLNGSLYPELWNAFCALVQGESVPLALRNKVIARCGREYKLRGLDPGTYFKPYRRESASSSARSIGRTA